MNMTSRDLALRARKWADDFSNKYEITKNSISVPVYSVPPSHHVAAVFGLEFALNIRF